MAKIKDPNRELAFKLWRENPNITNREIAKTLEVDEKKIATWKLRDKWKERISSATTETTAVKKKKCSTTKSVADENCNTTNDNVVQQNFEKKVSEEKSIKEKIIDVMVNGDLDDKQRAFCIYYMKSFNATQSAIKAGYSRDTAMEQGYQLLRKTSVKKYLTQLKELYAQEDYMEIQRILERHKQIAFADIKDFTEFQIEKVFMEYDDETGKPIFNKMFQFRIKDDFEVDGTLIKKIGMGKHGPVIELEDRSKSLDFLNKFYGLDPSIKFQNEKLEIERQRLEIEKNKNKDEDEEELKIEVEYV